jgi:hypothetical protein
MAQPSVSAFFIPRKRGIEDELVASKRKVICLDHKLTTKENSNHEDVSVIYPSSSNQKSVDSVDPKIKKMQSVASIRQGLTPQRTRSKRINQMQNIDGIETPKLVNFFVGGSLSPQKKSRMQKTEVTTTEPSKLTSQRNDDSKNKKHDDNNKKSTIEPQQIQNNEQLQKGMQTPPKKTKTNTIETNLLQIPNSSNNNSKSIEELKKKLRGSGRLTELKTSLNKLRNGFDKLDQMKEKRMASSSNFSAKEKPATTLKPFKNIELEIMRFVSILTF